jgi:N-acetylmuramoyl-L-alanine amidase
LDLNNLNEKAFSALVLSSTPNGTVPHRFEGCKSMESSDNLLPNAILRPPYRIKTIVLDAGHGGKDPGCKGASAHEKDNTLAIVLRLGAYIESNYPNIKVIYTRDSDVFIELNERAAIANRNNADLFISVHCNSIPKNTVHGAETYVLGLHRSKDNLDVAKRENASIYLEDDYQKNYAGYDPDSPEAEIFASVWQSAYLEQSILFASYVQQFASAVAFREDRGVKQAGFLVLRETAMPSVLIEAGYLTNATEDEFLASEEGQEQMGLSIFQAFEAYKRHMETGKPLDDIASAPAPAKPAATQPVVNKPVPAKTVAQKNTVPPGAKPAANKPGAVPGKSTTVAKPTPPPAPPSYTIFLLAWPNKLDPNVGQLSLLANVKEIHKEGKYHYYSGTYTSKAEAEKVLPELQNMGFKTASIVQN